MKAAPGRGTRELLTGNHSVSYGATLAGNANDGIVMWNSGATLNEVKGNYIGTNAAGTGDLGNGDDGVSIGNSPVWTGLRLNWSDSDIEQIKGVGAVNIQGGEVREIQIGTGLRPDDAQAARPVRNPHRVVLGREEGHGGDAHGHGRVHDPAVHADQVVPGAARAQAGQLLDRQGEGRETETESGDAGGLGGRSGFHRGSPIRACADLAGAEWRAVTGQRIVRTPAGAGQPSGPSLTET